MIAQQILLNEPAGYLPVGAKEDGNAVVDDDGKGRTHHRCRMSAGTICTRQDVIQTGFTGGSETVPRILAWQPQAQERQFSGTESTKKEAHYLLTTRRALGIIEQMFGYGACMPSVRSSCLEEDQEGRYNDGEQRGSTRSVGKAHVSGPKASF